MITYGELEGRVLRLLNKTPRNRGFFTEEKCRDAILEALDFVATEMFMVGNGWQGKRQFLPVAQANTLSIDLPPHMSMIEKVWYLVGDNYIELPYDDGSARQVQPADGTFTAYTSTYKLIDNAFYFTPALPDAAEKGLMVDYVSYPGIDDELTPLPAHYDNAMQHFVKYKAATILCTSFGQAGVTVTWAQQEGQWYDKVVQIIGKRNLQTTSVREFGE